MLDKLLFSTNSQRVLACMIQDVGREYLAEEIRRETGISKAGIHKALMDLIAEALVVRRRQTHVLFFMLWT